MGAEGGYEVVEVHVDWVAFALVVGVLVVIVAGVLIASRLTSDRAAITVVLLSLLVFAGASAWAVAGSGGRRCVWAVTVQTEAMRYLEVPCELSRPPSRIP